MPPSLEVVRTVPGINSQGGRQRFFCPQGGGVLELSVSGGCMEEMNGRFPGGGVLTLP